HRRSPRPPSISVSLPSAGSRYLFLFLRFCHRRRLHFNRCSRRSTERRGEPPTSAVDVSHSSVVGRSKEKGKKNPTRATDPIRASRAERAER
uniref:Uncharacterized protein n=1 Tax=Cucumis melo TaxID=3656 RepID=A0A9I9E3A1_CUCME